jgi:hypothetical protein
MVMSPEEKARIVNEAHATIERVSQMQQRTPQQTLDAEIRASAHFRPRAAEPDEIIRSEPVRTPIPAPVIEQPPVIAEDYIAELIATVVADVQDEFNAKLDALRAEIRELRSIGVADLREQLTRTLAKCTELVDRLEKREPMRGEVLDLPPLPSRARNVN